MKYAEYESTVAQVCYLLNLATDLRCDGWAETGEDIKQAALKIEKLQAELDAVNATRNRLAR